MLRTAQPARPRGNLNGAWGASPSERHEPCQRVRHYARKWRAWRPNWSAESKRRLGAGIEPEPCSRERALAGVSPERPLQSAAERPRRLPTRPRLTRKCTRTAAPRCTASAISCAKRISLHQEQAPPAAPRHEAAVIVHTLPRAPCTPQRVRTARNALGRAPGLAAAMLGAAQLSSTRPKRAGASATAEHCRWPQQRGARRGHCWATGGPVAGPTR